MSNYEVLTLDEIFRGYVSWACAGDTWDVVEEFLGNCRRALAAHDTEVRADEREKAAVLLEADALRFDSINTSLNASIATMLRDIASDIRAGARKSTGEPCSNCGRAYDVCFGGDDCDLAAARGDGETDGR